MARFLKKRHLKLAESPGSLVFLGNKKIDRVFLRVIEYSRTTHREMEGRHVRDIPELSSDDTYSWVSVYGLHDTTIIREIGEAFSIHDLVLEDILNTDQRPKLDEYDDHIFLVLKILRFNHDTDSVDSDQLSLLISGRYLITFQEQPIDLFKPLRERLARQKGRLRENGIDYLAYAIVDIVVDNYMAAIEEIGSRIEDLEEQVFQNPASDVLDRITTYKREINFLLKSVRPVRELVQRLHRLDADLVSEHTVPFLHDLQDHITQATETLDTYRDMLADHLSVYHSSISNKMNDIMKVLTIFAAIFIPLTFIAGIYGTNFDYLPELHYKYSYLIFWIVLLLVAGAMLAYFKKKGWF